MVKKLTTIELNKLSSKFNKQKKVSICNNEYEVTIYTNFRETKIDRVIMEYLSYIQNLKTVQELDYNLIKDTLSLLLTLVLREFTDLPIPKSKEIKNISNLIKVTHNLLDLGIFHETLNHIPEEQIAKVKERLDLVGNEGGKAMGELAVKMAVNEDRDIEFALNDTDAEIQ
ncbi:hypothetical protein D3C75_857320 [compost metagenome]